MYEFVTWNYDISENVSQTITGEHLHIFLDFCFERSQYFSLKTVEWSDSASTVFRKELKPFLVKQFRTQKWFGYDYSPHPLISPDETIEIQIYKATPKTKDILLKFCEDIFMKIDLQGKLVSSNQDLQDLCFLSNNKILVATVSHASILAVNAADEMSIATLEKVGKWIFREDNSSFPFLDQEIIV